MIVTWSQAAASSCITYKLCAEHKEYNIKNWREINKHPSHCNWV